MLSDDSMKALLEAARNNSSSIPLQPRTQDKQKAASHKAVARRSATNTHSGRVKAKRISRKPVPSNSSNPADAVSDSQLLTAMTDGEINTNSSSNKGSRKKKPLVENSGHPIVDPSIKGEIGTSSSGTMDRAQQPVVPATTTKSTQMKLMEMH